MAIKPYLQLVRLPNVFTAAADSLAGWLLVQGSFESPARWVPLLGASMAIYGGGIALNDVMDYEIDLAERPSRPLPSGRVPLRSGTMLSVVLLLAGLGLAALSGSLMSLAVAAALGGAVLLYDLGGKRTWLGPEIMGACRGINLLLGMSQAPQLGGSPAWVVAGAMALFVVGVTWISRAETETGKTKGAVAGLVLQNIGIFGLLAAAMSASRFTGGSERAGMPIVPLEGLFVLLCVALLVNTATGAAIRKPVPARLQKAVKTGVLSLVWLNVGIVAAVRGPLTALAVAVLWIPAFLLGRWLYST